MRKFIYRSKETMDLMMEGMLKYNLNVKKTEVLTMERPKLIRSTNSHELRPPPPSPRSPDTIIIDAKDKLSIQTLK